MLEFSYFFLILFDGINNRDLSHLALPILPSLFFKNVIIVYRELW